MKQRTVTPLEQQPSGKRLPVAAPQVTQVPLQPWHDQVSPDLIPTDHEPYIVGQIDDLFIVQFHSGRTITDQSEVISFISNQHQKEEPAMHDSDNDFFEVDNTTVEDYSLTEMDTTMSIASSLLQRYIPENGNPHTRWIGGLNSTATHRRAARALWSEMAWSQPTPLMWNISLDVDPAEPGFPQLYNAPGIAQLQCFELPDWHANYRPGVDTFAVVYYMSNNTWVTRTGETLSENRDKTAYLAVMDLFIGETRCEELRIDLIDAVRTLAGAKSARRSTDRDEEREVSEQVRRYKRELSRID